MNWMFIYLRNVLFGNNAQRFPVKNPFGSQRFLRIVTDFDAVRIEIDSVASLARVIVSLWWFVVVHQTHLVSNLIFQCTFAADSASSLLQLLLILMMKSPQSLPKWFVVVVVVVELCSYFIGVKWSRALLAQFSRIWYVFALIVWSMFNDWCANHLLNSKIKRLRIRVR